MSEKTTRSQHKPKPKFKPNHANLLIELRRLNFNLDHLANRLQSILQSLHNLCTARFLLRPGPSPSWSWELESELPITLKKANLGRKQSELSHFIYEAVNLLAQQLLARRLAY